MKWKERIKIGDLVRFSDEKRAKTRRTVSAKLLAGGHLDHLFEIGLVIDTADLDPVVSFPSRTQHCATANLEVI